VSAVERRFAKAQPQTLLTVMCAKRFSWRSSTLGASRNQSLHFDIVWLCVTSRVGKLPGRALRSYQRLLRQFVTVQEFNREIWPSQEDYDALIAFAKANA